MKFLAIAMITVFSLFANAGRLSQAADNLKKDTDELVRLSNLFDQTGSASKEQIQRQMEYVKQTLLRYNDELAMAVPGDGSEYFSRFVAMTNQQGWQGQNDWVFPVDTSAPVTEIAVRAQTASYRAVNFNRVDVLLASGEVVSLPSPGMLSGDRNQWKMFLVVAKFNRPVSVKEVRFSVDRKLDWAQVYGLR